MVWVFERTGRSATAGQLSPEEEQLDALQSQLVQQRTIYAADQPADPHAGEPDRRAAEAGRRAAARRARCPAPTASRRAPASELDVELAPIDARLKFIAEDKATIEKTLDDLDKSIQATPANEQVLAGLERELANLQSQYNAAVANRRPGPGRRAHRGAVQGRALLADRAAEHAGQARRARTAS